MRAASLILFCLLLTACSSMLLGGGGQGDRSPSTSAGASAPSAADQEISGAIRRAYSQDAALRQAGIGIRTQDLVVTLSGTVPSYELRERAVQIASSTPRVQRVSNRIVVNTNM